jgi:hypothetical protein
VNLNDPVSVMQPNAAVDGSRLQMTSTVVRTGWGRSSRKMGHATITSKQQSSISRASHLNLILTFTHFFLPTTSAACENQGFSRVHPRRTNRLVAGQRQTAIDREDKYTAAQIAVDAVCHSRLQGGYRHYRGREIPEISRRFSSTPSRKMHLDP